MIRTRLIEPMVPVRPEVMMRYKIEDGKDWFCVDRGAYLSIMNYTTQLEEMLKFAAEEIRESNQGDNDGKR